MWTRPFSGAWIRGVDLVYSGCIRGRDRHGLGRPSRSHGHGADHDRPLPILCRRDRRVSGHRYRACIRYPGVSGDNLHVGFRYRARHAAQLYGCTGWVGNEWDGSVTMEIQGTEEAIDKVILAIEAGRYVKIENMDSRTIPVESEERGFRTR